MATDYTIAMLVRAMGVQAEIEGMKALNKQRELDGNTLAHGDEDFYSCQNKLDEISRDILRSAP